MKKKLSPYDKALEINLDPLVYGTFAEIGAGQEVANWFFRASATAGTVAKSISAYDMAMSDAIYGKGKRYVSRERLINMLDHEFGLLIERLSEHRSPETTYFSFCNTVRARGYKDTGECHGWLGVRFQLRPGAEPSDILLHCRLLDWENTDQMEALGMLGVNFLYGAFHYREHLDVFLQSLRDGIGPGRIEVDMLKFDGAGFELVDNRLCSLELVQSGLTDAAMFTPDGEVVQPSETLYKRPVQLLRGSFDPVTNLHLDILSQTREAFDERLDPENSRESVEICELTMSNLLRQGKVDPEEFLIRADAMQRLGKTVLVSRLAEFYRISAYLTRYTSEPVAISLSIGLLNELFKDKWSSHLSGGILESFGRLFKNDINLYVYPWKNRHTGEMINADNFRPPEGLEALYQFFRDQGLVKSLACSDDDLLKFTGRDLKQMIDEGDETWKSYVPEIIHDLQRILL